MKKESKATVEVTVTLTAEQYEAVKELCAGSRVDVHEAGKWMLLELLRAERFDPGAWLKEIVVDANEDRRTGKHPVFESWKHARAKKVA